MHEFNNMCFTLDYCFCGFHIQFLLLVIFETFALLLVVLLTIELGVLLPESWLVVLWGRLLDMVAVVVDSLHSLLVLSGIP